MSLSGVAICAVSVGIFKSAALGVDPYQSFMSGINQLFPISYGTLYVIVNALLLSFSLIVDRHNIGIATFFNLFLFGYIVQFFQGILRYLIPEPSLPVRVIYLLIGLVILWFGSSLYMTAELGVSPYDAIANVLAYKWKIGKFQYCRIATDLVCVITGGICFLLGGGSIRKIPEIIGIGTIITAFFMGPFIEFFNVKIAKPMLHA